MVQTTRTGIFFTYFQGERLKDFPEALSGILDRDNVHYYDAVYQSTNGLYYLKPTKEELLLKIHSRALVEQVKRTGDYEAAVYSAGGTVHAAKEIFLGNIDNAFVFTSFGDHHAGRDYCGGMCYFNGAAIAIAGLKEKGIRRFAIVDTDSHHGDGTRDIFREDKDVLHLCFCYQDYSDDKNNNYDIAIPYKTEDETYLAIFSKELISRVTAFNPEIIFWEFGYDATQGEYGDKGITRDCHIRLAMIVKGVADHICNGRLITILCGGSSREIAACVIPRIIRCFADLNKDGQVRE